MRRNRMRPGDFSRRTGLAKRRRISMLKRKKRNRIKNSLKRGKAKIKRRYANRIEHIKIKVSGSFCFYNDTENVIALIESLNKNKTPGKWQKQIQIDLSSITDIDIGAISCLLAKVSEMTKNSTKVRVWGNSPRDRKCRKTFDESGFLDYMTDLSGNRFKKQSDNFLFRVGSDKTRNERVGKIVEQAIKFLTGIDEKFPPVYSIVQEICSNSVEWANSNSGTKNWFLGINKVAAESANEVVFTMTDIGEGILNTLKKKFFDIIRDLVLSKDTDVLKRAFDRKYGSRTEEANRNRGLPLIQRRFDSRFVKNLVVITNNVLYDFANPEKSRVLKRNFPGTFYLWSIDKQCVEKWKQKLK